MKKPLHKQIHERWLILGPINFLATPEVQIFERVQPIEFESSFALTFRQILPP